jgi:hypothetical protein
MFKWFTWSWLFKTLRDSALTAAATGITSGSTASIVSTVVIGTVSGLVHAVETQVDGSK